MNTAMQWMTHHAMIVMLIVTVGATVPTAGLTAPRLRPGDACLNQNYSGYARFETPGTPFASEEECLNYTNGGGTIVTLILLYSPDIGLYFQLSATPGWCTFIGGLEGFVPRMWYMVTFQARRTDGSGQPFPLIYWTTTLRADRYGNASFTFDVEVGYGAYEVRAEVSDGTVSGWRTIEC